MRLKHFLSVFLTLLTLSVGQMWGATINFNGSQLPTGWSGTGSFFWSTLIIKKPLFLFIADKLFLIFFAIFDIDRNVFGSFFICFLKGIPK